MSIALSQRISAASVHEPPRNTAKAEQCAIFRSRSTCLRWLYVRGPPGKKQVRISSHLRCIGEQNNKGSSSIGSGLGPGEHILATNAAPKVLGVCAESQKRNLSFTRRTIALREFTLRQFNLHLSAASMMDWVYALRVPKGTRAALTGFTWSRWWCGGRRGFVVG